MKLTEWTAKNGDWEIHMQDGWWQVAHWTNQGNTLNFVGWWPPETKIGSINAWLTQRGAQEGKCSAS